MCIDATAHDQQVGVHCGQFNDDRHLGEQETIEANGIAAAQGVIL